MSCLLVSKVKCFFIYDIVFLTYVIAPLRVLMGVSTSQLTTNFSAKYQLTTIFLANSQLTTNFG